MNSQQALDILAKAKPILATQFGVTHLALFGSTVRNAARQDSDIDVLVRFNGATTFERYFGVQFYLEDLLGAPVDLVTDKAQRAERRAFIDK